MATWSGEILRWGTSTGYAIKIQSHIFSPTGYNLNFSAVFGLAADKVHPFEFFN